MSPRVAVADQIFERVGAVKTVIIGLALCTLQSRSHAQTLTALERRMFDASGRLPPRAMVVRDESTIFEVAVQTENEGRYCGARPRRKLQGHGIC